MARHARLPTAANHTDGPCPCGSGYGRYDDCCAELHHGQATAATAEVLMRSRFAAFAVADAGYLLRTWHPSTRPAAVRLDPDQRWTRLDVLATSGGAVFETTGTVRFRAHYLHRGRPGTLAEHSRFRREDGRWHYLDALPPGD